MKGSRFVNISGDLGGVRASFALLPQPIRPALQFLGLAPLPIRAIHLRPAARHVCEASQDS
ncbi:MAG: hypothetical protein R2795_00950 [Saprospiraceae bacterium]